MVDVKDDMTNNVDSEGYSAASTADPKNVQELTQYSLLQTIQDKFQNMSDQILTRIDEMGTRIDDLEKNIGDLMTQAGVEGPDK
ncbi:heat shock factor-binding protein 1 isoform X2 [Euwallacea fornicatus]|uniref:heat shock factor-binding protein 1 isoform X2 n=1 Tax=Euwallacea fornicatus TaxID=995702 RepID=UPI0033907139